MAQRKKRGIAILLSLFMAVLVVMFVTTMVTLLPQTADDAVNSKEGKASMQAARDGLEYAWARLQKNPTWRGDSNAWTVNTSTTTRDLYVVEDKGNVWGFISSPSGEQSQFRIRFNYQNVGAPNDGLGNPAAAHYIKTTYVSFNNLNGIAEAFTPFATSGGNFPVTGLVGAGDGPAKVPAFACTLRVEGLAGDGLRDASPTNPSPPRGNRRVVSRLLEVTIGRSNLGSLDSAVYGAQVNATVVGSNFVIDSQTSAAPRLRTLTTGNVNGGNYTSTTSSSAKVVVGINATNLNDIFHVTGGTISNATINYESQAAQKQKWIKLKSSDIPAADPFTDPQIKAGTYVWRPNGDLDYYAQSYDGVTLPAGAPAQTFPSAPSNTSINSFGPPNSVYIDHSTYTMTVTNNVFVKPQGAVKGLYVIPDPAIALAGDRPKTLFNSTTMAPVLTSTENVTIQGALLGKGSVNAGNDITFQGPSVFETDPNKSVAVYAKRDINLQKIPDPVAADLNAVVGSPAHHGHHSRHHHGHHLSIGQTYGTPNNFFGGVGPFGSVDGNDVVMAGVVYAGRNFNTDLGTGTMYIRGVLAAYGGDVDLGQAPGTPGAGGVVNITAHNAQVSYDPAFISQAVSQTTPSRLSQLLYEAR